jgi:tail protein
VFNDTTSQVMNFTGTLDANTYLDVDMANFTIFLNSDPTRNAYSWLNLPASQWWRVMPGSNYLRFAVDAVSGPAQTQVTWSDTYV